MPLHWGKLCRSGGRITPKHYEIAASKGTVPFSPTRKLGQSPESWPKLTLSIASSTLTPVCSLAPKENAHVPLAASLGRHPDPAARGHGCPGGCLGTGEIERRRPGQAIYRILRSQPCGRWRSRPPGCSGPPTSPARKRTSRRSRKPKRRSNSAWPIPSGSPSSKPSGSEKGTVPGNTEGDSPRFRANVTDPLLAREIAVLYLEYLGKQVDPDCLKKMLAKSNAVERAFNVFRPKVDGKELTDNDVRRILQESHDSAERRPPGRPARRSGRWWWPI